MDLCDLPAKPGPCRAFFQRFYYDSASNECKKFAYGGCRGNKNNFRSIEDCQKRCSNAQ
jgi:hypothetical protein